MFNKLKSKQKILSRITFFITVTLALIGISAAVICFAPISKAVSTTPRFTSLYTTGTGGGYQQGTNVNIQWTIAEPVPYGEWFVGLYSSSGAYYDYTVLSAGSGSSSTSFSYNLPVSAAPVESGYRAVVAYRATSSDSWISVTSSSDTFAITAAGTSTTNTGGTVPPPVTAKAPTLTSLTTTSTSNYKQGTNIGIQWRTASPVASGEWFVGLYSSSGVYYDYVISNVGIGGTSTAFGYTQLISTAPVGSGYRAVVAYRATASDSWTSVTSSSNTFTITAGGTTTNTSNTPTLKSLSTTGSGNYEQGSVVGIQWTTAQAVASGEWFVGLYSSSGKYYDNVITNIGVGTNYANFSYTLSIPTAPVGTGYRAVVAYRANANSNWVNVTSSSNTFSVVAATTTDTQDKVVGRTVTNSLCKVNANNVPNSLLSLDIVKQMAENCKKFLPLEEAFLGKSTCKFTEDNRLSIVFNDKYKNVGVAVTVGCVINYQISNISQINTSTLPHEIAHAVQHFSNPPPYYLDEAMASYMVHYFGIQDSASGSTAPKSLYGYCLASDWVSYRYDRGYDCGAVYLKFIEKTYSPSIVKNIHNLIKNGQAKGKKIGELEIEISAFIISSTKSATNPKGLTREQVYQNCLASTDTSITCKGGRP